MALIRTNLPLLARVQTEIVSADGSHNVQVVYGWSNAGTFTPLFTQMNVIPAADVQTLQSVLADGTKSKRENASLALAQYAIAQGWVVNNGSPTILGEP